MNKSGVYHPKTLSGQKQDGAPGASSCRKTATSGAAKPSKGAGRARGINIWYPNTGVASSSDPGECSEHDD